MHFCKRLLSFLILIYVSSSVFASQTSVLLPGSRIVAGDLSQNEFYILAANDSSKATITQPLNIKIKDSFRAHRDSSKAKTIVLRKHKIPAESTQLAKIKPIHKLKFAFRNNSRKVNMHHAIIALNGKAKHFA